MIINPIFIVVCIPIPTFVCNSGVVGSMCVIIGIPVAHVIGPFKLVKLEVIEVAVSALFPKLCH
jgi:hypothetical protein